MNSDLHTVLRGITTTHGALDGLFGEDGPIVRLEKYIEDLERENADSRDRIAALQSSYTKAKNLLTEESNRASQLKFKSAGLADKVARLEAGEATMAPQMDRLVARIKELEAKLELAEGIKEKAESAARRHMGHVATLLDELEQHRKPAKEKPGRTNGWYAIETWLPGRHSDAGWSKPVLASRPVNGLEVMQCREDTGAWRRYHSGGEIEQDFPTWWLPIPELPKKD